MVHLHLTTSDETNVRRFLLSATSISLMARVRGSDRRREEVNDVNVEEEESACSNVKNTQERRCAKEMHLKLRK